MSKTENVVTMSDTPAAERTTSRRDLLAVALVMMLLGLVTPLALSNHRQRTWEKRFIALHERLALGMSFDEVLAVVNSEQWPPEYLYLENQESVRISSPMTLGAHNWIFYLDFEDKALVSLEVRTPDRPGSRPYAPAPPDLKMPKKLPQRVNSPNDSLDNPERGVQHRSSLGQGAEVPAPKEQGHFQESPAQERASQ